MDATVRTLDNRRSIDKILTLKKTGPSRTSAGLLDDRLFTGGNKLHVKMDTQTCLWYFEYENGILPGALKSQFTTSGKALIFAKDYFKRRNVEIAEIID